MSPTVAGEAEVVNEGKTMILIPPANASQADGEPVTVSYSVRGDVLTTHVDLQGPVDFPVLVDPIAEVVGYYGWNAYGKLWEYWHSGENCACFSFGDSGNISIGRSGRASINESFGQWYISFANPNIRIMRVDLGGVSNGSNYENQNYLQAGIYEERVFNKNGHGIYTYNGTNPKETHAAPLDTTAVFVGRDAAFCAYGTGTGSDGGAQPLCYEEEGGEGFAFGLYKQYEGGTEEGGVAVESAAVRFISGTTPTVALTGLHSRWFNSADVPDVEVEGKDGATGIAEVGLDAVPANEKLPESPGSRPAPGTTPWSPTCGDPFCPEWARDPISLSGLSTGVWRLGGWTRNAVDNFAVQEDLAYVDNTPPSIEEPAWANATFADGSHVLSFSAQDGSSSAPAAGTAFLELDVDGREVYARTAVEAGCPEPVGIPSGNCFKLSGSWTLNTEDLAPGEHEITIHAEDWAGNWEEASYPITIPAPAGQTQQVGPGTLNLQTGDYKLTATDVSFPAGTASLTVSRTYDSHSASTSVGPLGPGWTLSTPDTSAAGQWLRMEVLKGGAVEATGTSGQLVEFEAKAARRRLHLIPRLPDLHAE